MTLKSVLREEESIIWWALLMPKGGLRKIADGTPMLFGNLEQLNQYAFPDEKPIRVKLIILQENP